MKPTIDRLYDDEFYAYADQCARHAAPFMVEDIVNTFHPGSVIDVGCGSGALLQCLDARGITARGLEHSRTGLAICRDRGLDVADLDLESDWREPVDRYDIAVSLEVAEHLAGTFARPFVRLLCALAPVIVFSAAPPGQDGLGHFNEQPYTHWQALFRERGFQMGVGTAERWREHWVSQGVAYFYHQNLMIFSEYEPR